MRFQYSARTEGGQKVTGTLEAESEAAALRVLEDRKLFPISVLGSSNGATKR